MGRRCEELCCSRNKDANANHAQEMRDLRSESTIPAQETEQVVSLLYLSLQGQHFVITTSDFNMPIFLQSAAKPAETDGLLENPSQPSYD